MSKKKSLPNKTSLSDRLGFSSSESSLPIQLYFPPHFMSTFRHSFYSLATKYVEYCIAPKYVEYCIAPIEYCIAPILTFTYLILRNNAISVL